MDPFAGVITQPLCTVRAWCEYDLRWYQGSGDRVHNGILVVHNGHELWCTGCMMVYWSCITRLYSIVDSGSMVVHNGRAQLCWMHSGGARRSCTTVHRMGHARFAWSQFVAVKFRGWGQ